MRFTRSEPLPLGGRVSVVNHGTSGAEIELSDAREEQRSRVNEQPQSVLPTSAPPDGRIMGPIVPRSSFPSGTQKRGQQLALCSPQSHFLPTPGQRRRKELWPPGSHVSVGSWIHSLHPVRRCPFNEQPQTSHLCLFSFLNGFFMVIFLP